MDLWTWFISAEVGDVCIDGIGIEYVKEDEYSIVDQFKKSIWNSHGWRNVSLTDWIISNPLAEKITITQYVFDETGEKPKPTSEPKPCSCSIQDLMQSGCKCGGI